MQITKSPYSMSGVTYSTPTQAKKKKKKKKKTFNVNRIRFSLHAYFLNQSYDSFHNTLHKNGKRDLDRK